MLLFSHSVHLNSKNLFRSTFYVPIHRKAPYYILNRNPKFAYYMDNRKNPSLLRKDKVRTDWHISEGEREKIEREVISASQVHSIKIIFQSQT